MKDKKQPNVNNTDKNANQPVDNKTLSKEQLIEKLNQSDILNQALVFENDQLIANQAELDKKISKTDEYINQLAILRSDFDSFRRRNKEVEQTSLERGKLNVIEQLLPILDTFERAKLNITDKVSIEAFELILKQYLKILSEIGVVEIDVLNQEFDVKYANAINKAEVEEQLKNKVLEVYSKGYKYNGTNGEVVLRYAQVSVGV